MPPALISGGIGILGQIGGDILGGIAAGPAREAAKKAMADAYAEIQKVGAPPDMARQLILQHFKTAGILTPQLEQNITQAVSKVDGIQEDPNLRNAQTSALGLLSQRGQTGLSAEDVAGLNKIRAGAQSDAEASRQAIMQNLQARGQFGSGAELAGQLAASQAGSQRESDAGINQAGIASQRALEALVAGGQLGGQIRGQDFSVNNTRASAADQLARFNTQNAIGTQTRNVGSQNNANEYNVRNNQNISNSNVALDNAETQRQFQGQQQNWQNQVKYAQTRADADKAQAGYLQGQGDNTARDWGHVAAGIGTAGGAIANEFARQPAEKPSTPGVTTDNYGPLADGKSYAGYIKNRKDEDESQQ